MTYFDTAYIVKCYVKEDCWQQARELSRKQERVACPVYGMLELHGELHRKMREHARTERQLEVVLRQFRVDGEARLWTWLPLTAAVMTEVAATFTSLPGDVFLRTRGCRPPPDRKAERTAGGVQQRPAPAERGARGRHAGPQRDS